MDAEFVSSKGKTTEIFGSHWKLCPEV